MRRRLMHMAPNVEPLTEVYNKPVCQREIYFSNEIMRPKLD